MSKGIIFALMVYSCHKSGKNCRISFIVTNDCKVATGGNVMIVDAIQSIMIDIAEVDEYADYFLRFKWHGHPEYEGSEWGVMVTDVTQLDRAFALVTKQLN